MEGALGYSEDHVGRAKIRIIGKLGLEGYPSKFERSSYKLYFLESEFQELRSFQDLHLYLLPYGE